MGGYVHVCVMCCMCVCSVNISVVYCCFLTLTLCFTHFQVESEQELRSLASALEREGKDFKLWVEQPENYPTCLATKPYPKTDIQQYFKKYKLLS